MERQATFLVDFASILQVPEIRTRAILARKALACRAGFKTTRPLRRHHIETDRDAVEALAYLSHNLTGFSTPRDQEPADVSDASDEPVSLEEFCVTNRLERIEFARTIRGKLQYLVQHEDWENAADVAIDALFKLRGRTRRHAVEFLKEIATHDVRAKLFYGKCLIRGEHVAADTVKGEALLREVVDDDDPLNAGFAHMLLGETLMTVAGKGYEALRHFEGAAYLGWEDGSEYAGVLCQMGSNGVPLDLPRAVRNFKYGIAAGQGGCMAKYALMVLSGDVDYDPQWQEFYEGALNRDDNVALAFYQVVLDAQEVAGGDLNVFLSVFKKGFERQVATNIQGYEYTPVFG